MQELSVITHYIHFDKCIYSMALICLLDVNINVKFGWRAGSSKLMHVHLRQVRTCDFRSYLTW